ncbi:MAG TPA: helicase HerA-like domain-containing protein [Pirellulales bacterium]|nr:helicase HerA-like domain-containing protein [Pirellulales bacterium]
MSDSVLIGKGKLELRLLARMANRHGLVAGATGTGKTVTLRVMAEGLSALGVPVFLSDVKGDLAGMAQAGEANPKFAARAKEMGIADYAPAASPVVFWDVLAEQGIPIRATISDMGPLLLGRLLNLNETQNGVLNIVFKVADQQGLLLLDLKDLTAMLQHVGQNAKEYSTGYGNVSPASVGAIQRGLLALSEQGADKFFGEPMLTIEDLLARDAQGRGVVNILAADKLMSTPKVYATFLLWLLADLYEKLPEVGDMDKPKLVFFFDEAHLLFDEAPKVVLEKVEQVVRLIRSKGVGVFFASQNPLDIPETVLGQLGNRVQHALRSFTPKDQKAVRAAAQTFRNDGSVDVEQAIGQLAVGEALCSLLDETGSPMPVEVAKVAPPRSRLGAIADGERQKIVHASPLYGHYAQSIDRESAYEMLKARASGGGDGSDSADKAGGKGGKGSAKSDGGEHDEKKHSWWTGVSEVLASAGKVMNSRVGAEIIRGVLGSRVGGSPPRRRRS